MTISARRPRWSAHDRISLPRYTRTSNTEWDIPPAEQEHVFSLHAKKTGARWLTLTVTSRAASKADTPTFYQGGNITGNLRLELDREESMDEISIALYGRLDIFSHSSCNFLYMSRILYSAAESPPDSPKPSRRGRLSGRHEWPYSFRLPKGISILTSITTDGHAERQTYRLPPGFSDAQSDVHVQYSLVVRVDRGGFRASRKLVVPIQYVPLARPSAPTILRQLAYQQNTALAGLDDDPDGWKTLGPVRVKGLLFKTVEAEAVLQLAVSRPLTYARGGPIHLLISISSANEQFFDLINPQSVHLALVQRITFGQGPHTTRFSRRLSETTTVKAFERAAASWWRPAGPQQPARAKTFAGEILTPEDLVPPSQIMHYGHEYELVLYPLSAVGFSPSSPARKALLSEPVTIVTAFAQGPRPKSYLPPEYNV
ncbi:hypothetical protein C8Q80DRAFT_1218531 [Daedaleopsis nitida]|nr:hypothetical protein C8Q80DRAFT_1218531 [Daedaleopsis nitida]